MICSRSPGLRPRATGRSYLHALRQRGGRRQGPADARRRQIALTCTSTDRVMAGFRLGKGSTWPVLVPESPVSGVDNDFYSFGCGDTADFLPWAYRQNKI